MAHRKWSNLLSILLISAMCLSIFPAAVVNVAENPTGWAVENVEKAISLELVPELMNPVITPLKSSFSSWEQKTDAQLNNAAQNRQTTEALASAISQPVITPIPEAWQSAYAEFLKQNVRTEEVDFDTLVEGSDAQARYMAFSAGGYPITPFYYLYDIDKDEVPELICIDAAKGFEGDVYSYIDNSVIEIGSIRFYPFGGLGMPLDQTGGLYSDVGYKGHYGEIYFYTMNSGVLTGQMVLEYNNQPELSVNQPGLPYSFSDFSRLDYYEVTEANLGFTDH